MTKEDIDLALEHFHKNCNTLPFLGEPVNQKTIQAIRQHVETAVDKLNKALNCDLKVAVTIDQNHKVFVDIIGDFPKTFDYDIKWEIPFVETLDLVEVKIKSRFELIESSLALNDSSRGPEAL